MQHETLKQLDSDTICPTYARFDVCLASGKGSYATDTTGKEYLDFTSGIGVNSLGFCDEEWCTAVAKQTATLQHTSNLFYTLPSTQLAQALCTRTGMSKVFFANSGAEANEGAIKAARKHSSNTHGQARSTIVTLLNSFHGRTMATLTATGQDAFHQHFGPFLPGFKYVPAGDIAALQTALTPDVCAVMLEVIQGEGGVVPLPAAYLQQLRQLCTQQNILVIADEIQTGVGRTGSFLACQQTGLQPDIVTLAKGLGGGLPIGAFLLGASCAGALTQGDHGSTFGANPVCCAGANVVLNRLNSTFLAEVAQKGLWLKQQLQALPGVQGVTGTGLMLGVTFHAPHTAAGVLQTALQHGLLCLTAKQKLRLLPPLTITLQELAQGIAILKKSLSQL